ncbi:MAG: ABC transporter permease [Bacteroidetes bacterium]|nr:ABC transporter permease [Bacteroidota bacterium]
MLFNYLKTAIRSLWRHRFFSSINIIGLAVAMSICMGIIMLVADQLSYDRYNTNAARIYRINTIGVDDQGRTIDQQENAASTMRLRQELEEAYTGIEKVVRIKRGFGNNWLEFEGQDVNIPLTGFFADPEVFDLFQYEFLYGNSTTALKEPFSVVLTHKAAKKLFKEENPVGLTIKVGRKHTYTVTGVLKDTPNKSHIVFEGLASMSSEKSILNEKEYKDDMESWTNIWNGWTYILLEQGKSTADIQRHLDQIYQQHIAKINNPGLYKAKFKLQPLLGITLGMFNNPIGPGLPLVFVYFLSGLAAVILLTSCFNFTNLSIARSLTRAREIGVRKVTGAARWQIFSQFLTESILVAMVALAIALVLLIAIKPLILQLNFARIFRWDLQTNYIVYAIFIVFATVVGVLAGLFPAVVLSGFQPVKVLKNLNGIKLFSRMGMRKVLLVSQFSLSLFFIITVIVMYNQLNLFVHQSHGFNMDNNILVRLNGTSRETFKNELTKYNNIISVSGASHIPAAGTSYGNGFKRSLQEHAWTSFGYFFVDEDYINNMDLKLKAGKFFDSGAGESNKNLIVINEAAVKKMQFGTALDAVGEELIFEADSSRKTIIGVVADYNHRDLTHTLDPLALMYDADRLNLVQVRYAGTFEQAAKTVERAWAAVNPGVKVDYKEVESEVKQFYEIVFGDIVKVLGVIAFLAILISCLGLLGMATYTTETRIKEISIRKVLGSSSGALVLLLSKGFVVILALAVVIGVPLAYFANNLWLQLIAYHTTIDLTVILIGVAALILFGIITIGSQTIRATFVKPVENLKE